jgi:lipopolysaccharide assembly protein B
MDLLAQWLLTVVAIAIGWILGRWGGRGLRKESSLPRVYPLPERFAFDNFSDEAIDKYVQGLEVSSHTLPMHFSIAGHFRKKGEVERAILIHQSLLAHPALETDSRERATLELARDYMSAGLLDRAEALLRQLEGSKRWRSESLELLLDLLQEEKEWAAACETALKLDFRKNPRIQKRLAHYHCEVAQGYLKNADPEKAIGALKAAFGCDRSSVRASFMLAQIYRERSDFTQALTVLRRVEEQDPQFVPEIIPGLVVCYRELGQDAKLQQHLAAVLEHSKSARALIAYAETIREHENDLRALEFMADQLNSQPSVKGLDYLVELQMSRAPIDQRRKFEAIRQVTQKLLKDKPPYLCENCGFASKALIWLCPSCKRWETIKPVRGVEGE